LCELTVVVVVVVVFLSFFGVGKRVNGRSNRSNTFPMRVKSRRNRQKPIANDSKSLSLRSLCKINKNSKSVKKTWGGKHDSITCTQHIYSTHKHNIKQKQQQQQQLSTTAARVLFGAKCLDRGLHGAPRQRAVHGEQRRRYDAKRNAARFNIRFVRDCVPYYNCECRKFCVFFNTDERLLIKCEVLTSTQYNDQCEKCNCCIIFHTIINKIYCVLSESQRFLQETQNGFSKQRTATN
jgi:hypothetical protein